VSGDFGKPTIICLTPVRNEAWILDRFLQCASLWADHIIIADQHSDDASREIARSCSKVTLIDNSSLTYNEVERQKILLAAARQFPAPRLLLTLDADEMLTSNSMSSPEWPRMLEAPVGTVMYFRWVNLRPDLKSYWSPENVFPWGFMDDGSEHAGSVIHSFRLPVPAGAPKLQLQEIKVLHYQYTKWERMESKHRWYQCLERLMHPSRSAVDIYRQYHHMYSISRGEILPVREDWVSGYERQGIDMRTIRNEAMYWWDREVLKMFAQHGAKRFRREAIWDADWSTIAKNINICEGRMSCQDPRSIFDRILHSWLRRTQPLYHKAWVKRVDRALAEFGW
jgi:hypothetical protein